MTTNWDYSEQSIVFVVDDDPAARDSLLELISSIDLTPACFSSAEQFLECYDQSRQGCLVLDVRMPGMSGIDLQFRFRQDRTGG